MTSWPRRPIIYEINTWVWLHELRLQYGSHITLDDVPAEEWDALGSLGTDAVWLMGVWQRSPAGIRIARYEQGLELEYRRVLADFSPEDVVGSPYSVHRYVVDEQLGGPAGLAAARASLVRRGMRLVLDLVPNHVAPDHPWVTEHPEYLLQGDASDLQHRPPGFFERGGRVFACGRDPYFPAWLDTAQLNAFSPALRRAMIETVSGIAAQCDGIRCDMAMLLMNQIFERTWGARARARPSVEFWPEVIGAVRRRHPDALFMAEAYWDLEWELQQQGFDFCYDKRLYDRLVHGPAESVRQHLLADLDYQSRLVRFIENHDEPRAAATFGTGERARAAAVVTLTLPGAKLLHDGQLDGRRVKLPVQLGRRPKEPADRELRKLYGRLLVVANTSALRDGDWRLCERSGWPDNATHVDVVAWCWRKGDERYLIAVNLADHASQARIRLPWEDLRGHSCVLWDALSGALYERDGGEMLDPGLYVALEPWGAHVLSF